MWRKMLKLRDVDKSFYRKDLGNGRHTSFWYDRWSDRGVLSDLLGERGIMYLGVKRKATVEEQF